MSALFSPDGVIDWHQDWKMRITTKEQAQKLTVPKLREELGLRGLPQEGLKVIPYMFPRSL